MKSLNETFVNTTLTASLYGDISKWATFDWNGNSITKTENPGYDFYFIFFTDKFDFVQYVSSASLTPIS